MLTRHLNLLMERLERVLEIGAAEITKTELMRWYGAQRMVRSIWRDIEEKWREVDDQGQPLLVGESDGLWLFVYGEGITCSKDAWLKPCSERGG